MTTTAEMTPTSLRLPCKECVEADVLQGELKWFCIVVPPSLWKRSWDNYAESLTYIHILHVCFNLL
jgi:hypothetical protein